MSILGHTMCIAVAALVINLVVSAVFTLVFRLARLPDGAGETRPAQYEDAAPAPAATAQEGVTATGAADPRAAQ